MQGKVSYCPFCGEIFSSNILSYKLTSCPQCKSDFCPTESKFTVEKYQSVATQFNKSEEAAARKKTITWEDVLLTEIKNNPQFDSQKYEARIHKDKSLQSTGTITSATVTNGAKDHFKVDLSKSSGAKVRLIAQIIQWIGIISFVAWGTSYIMLDQWLIGLVVITAGIFGSIVNTIILNGFSEIIDNSHIIAQHVSHPN